MTNDYTDDEIADWLRWVFSAVGPHGRSTRRDANGREAPEFEELLEILTIVNAEREAESAEGTGQTRSPDESE